MCGPWLPRSPQFHFFAMVGPNLATLTSVPTAFLGQYRLPASTDEQKWN
jgi:hypothetical protein